MGQLRISNIDNNMVKGTLNLMFRTKFKTPAIAGPLILLAAATATIAVKQAHAADAATNSPRQEWKP